MPVNRDFYAKDGREWFEPNYRELEEIRVLRVEGTLRDYGLILHILAYLYKRVRGQLGFCVECHCHVDSYHLTQVREREYKKTSAIGGRFGEWQPWSNYKITCNGCTIATDDDIPF